jgi:hypothetical protein
VVRRKASIDVVDTYLAIMPCLSIQTNSALGDEQQTELLRAALKIVASQLGKRETYVMVSIAPGVRMNFVDVDAWL